MNAQYAANALSSEPFDDEESLSAVRGFGRDPKLPSRRNLYSYITSEPTPVRSTN